MSNEGKNGQEHGKFWEIVKISDWRATLNSFLHTVKIENNFIHWDKKVFNIKMSEELNWKMYRYTN